MPLSVFVHSLTSESEFYSFAEGSIFTLYPLNHPKSVYNGKWLICFWKPKAYQENPRESSLSTRSGSNWRRSFSIRIVPTKFASFLSGYPALRCFVWVIFAREEAQNASLRSIKKPA